MLYTRQNNNIYTTIVYFLIILARYHSLLSQTFGKVNNIIER